MSRPVPSKDSKTLQEPWTYKHDADGDFGIFWGNKHICTTVSDTVEDEAHARLIIAAPDMLAVLRDYEQLEADLVLSSEAWDNGNRELPEITNALWEKLLAIQAKRNAAIAKVEKSA